MDLSDLARIPGNGQPIAETTKGNSVAAVQQQPKEPGAAPSALLNQQQLEDILKVAEKTASDLNLNLRFEYRQEANVFQVQVFDVTNNLLPETEVDWVKFLEVMLKKADGNMNEYYAYPDIRKRLKL